MPITFQVRSQGTEDPFVTQLKALGYAADSEFSYSGKNNSYCTFTPTNTLFTFDDNDANTQRIYYAKQEIAQVIFVPNSSHRSTNYLNYDSEQLLEAFEKARQLSSEKDDIMFDSSQSITLFQLEKNKIIELCNSYLSQYEGARSIFKNAKHHASISKIKTLKIAINSMNEDTSTTSQMQDAVEQLYIAELQRKPSSSSIGSHFKKYTENVIKEKPFTAERFEREKAAVFQACDRYLRTHPAIFYRESAEKINVLKQEITKIESSTKTQREKLFNLQSTLLQLYRSEHNPVSNTPLQKHFSELFTKYRLEENTAKPVAQKSAGVSSTSRKRVKPTETRPPSLH